MKKAVILTLLVAVLICPLCKVEAADITASGKWYDLSWTLYSDGLMVVQGSGPMGAGLPSDYPTWEPFADQIITVKIGEGITTISPVAFYSYKNLTTVMLPDSLTEIGMAAFWDCESLKNVLDSKGAQKLPDKVHTLGMGVFYNCFSLETLDLGKSVYSLDSSVFGNCTSLREITLSPTLTLIGSDCFNDCISLTSITIPGWVSSMDVRMFMGCLNLKEIYFTGDAPAYKTAGTVHMFYNPEMTLTTTVYYPEGNPTWTQDKLIQEDYLEWKAIPMEAPTGPRPTAPIPDTPTPPTTPTTPTTAPTSPTTAPTIPATQPITTPPTTAPAAIPTAAPTAPEPTAPSATEPIIEADTQPKTVPQESASTPADQTDLVENTENPPILLWIGGGLGVVAVAGCAAVLLKKKLK